MKKGEIRKIVWDRLHKLGISRRPKGDYGKIPDFKGSIAAALRLSKTIEWKNSKRIFSSPDSAQRPVRELALYHGKDLIMPTPRLKKGYLYIRANDARGCERFASTIRGAYRLGSPIKVFPKIDLVVEGSVAVDMNGNRLGKGGGYGDREIKELKYQGAITEQTPIVTTVDETQIIKKVPVEPHDEKINMIVTPKRVIRLK
ncbi:MAG: 5-formyltetrahydrofolate cyclo-ligase [Methanothermobacter sp.]|nr:5-formyltetrahydrofolate cyclo-ligase [Methanothermobacter sp.]